jgi:hypothetical protein
MVKRDECAVLDGNCAGNVLVKEFNSMRKFSWTVFMDVL